MPLLQPFRQSSRPIQVLVLNQLSFNTSFYMVLPYLSSYLSGELSFAASMVGLVLGLRTLSQQGLFIVGGTLADRIGYKPVIIAGCLVRVLGFALFAVVSTLPGVIVAVFLSGFAAALFSPAVETYLAHAAGARRVEAFALFNSFGEVGALIGPLLGAALLGLSFPAVCLVASGIFLLIALVQIRFLPARAGGEAGSAAPLLADWAEALRNRRFVCFALAMFSAFTLYNQLYLGLPLAVRQLTGNERAISLLFVLSALLWIVGQVPIAAYCRRRWRPPQVIAAGMAIGGLAFLPLALALLIRPLPGAGAPNATPLALALLPILLSTALLALGMMLAQPFARAQIPALSGGRRLGTYYGLYALAAGVGAALGNSLSGLLFDLAGQVGLPWLPWLLLTLLGLLSALAILALDRHGMLAADPPASQPVALS